jgi:hypothetical protein
LFGAVKRAYLEDRGERELGHRLDTFYDFFQDLGVGEEVGGALGFVEVRGLHII